MGRAPCCEKIGLKKGRWTAEEDEILTTYIQANGEGSWRSLPKNAGTQVARIFKCSVCFRLFSSTADAIFSHNCRYTTRAFISQSPYIQFLCGFLNSNSCGCFHFSKGLLRCGKSCRLRWINYLRADLKRGNITAEEEETIVKLHSSLGNRYVQPLKIACISDIF